MSDGKALNGTTMYQSSGPIGLWYKTADHRGVAYMIRTCVTCGIEFFAHRSGILRGYGTHCSRECAVRRGPDHHKWSGENPRYVPAHMRVWSKRGKASRCLVADETCSPTFNWANLTDDYGTLSDYIELCASHHIRLDRRRRRGGDVAHLLLPASMRKECERIITSQTLAKIMLELISAARESDDSTTAG